MEENDLRVVVCATAAIAGVLIQKPELLGFPATGRKKRRVWMRKWLKQRYDLTQQNTIYKLQKELLKCDTEEFQTTMRMPPDIYQILLEKVRPLITKTTTNFRRPISAEERLALTLRYLALGDGLRSLHQQFRVGFNTVGRIIRETCMALYQVLREDYLKTPSTTAEWEQVAEDFFRSWNFPHVLGALDGKHIRIVCPPSSGTYFYNYKHYFSIVLMALVNANYEFIFVDIGAEGKASDGGIWRKSSLYEMLNAADNPLNIPGPETCHGVDTPLPYFIIGDDAFGMAANMIKPYSQLGLTDKARIFNYRLSRARRVVENAFGIMSARFRIFHREIEMRPENVENLVMAAVCLHNFLRRECPGTYTGACMLDNEDGQHELVHGIWGGENQLDSVQPVHGRNASVYAKKVRERLASYFLQKEGELKWQYRLVSDPKL